MIESGTVLQDRFLIDGRIGEGGMGAVYLAVDQKFGSRVAIKETFFGDEELAAAFEREARLLNGLHHPIFPHVSDHFTDENGHFLVMEYIEGEDLSALLKRGETFSVDEVMRWTLDLLDGLDYLHSQDPPVIHRDIKPNNLKLTSRGNIVLLDFGMAKETSGNTLGMRSVFGYSRRYSPLEQIEGTGTDARSDIFSLGATIFHLLTGSPPVDVLARASAIVAGRPDPLRSASEIRPDVPESVAAILNSALSLNPEHRFVSARAMWNALEYALGLDFGEQGASSAVDEIAGPVETRENIETGDAFTDGKGRVLSSPEEEEIGVAVPFLSGEGSVEPSAGASDNISAQVHAEIVEPHGSAPETDGPIDRAVIHLRTVDGEDEHLEFSDEQPETQEPAAPIAMAALLRPGLSATLSRPVVWVPILLICAVLALAGLFGSNENARVQGADTVSNSSVPPANAVGVAEAETARSNSGETEPAVSVADADTSSDSETPAADKGPDENGVEQEPDVAARDSDVKRNEAPGSLRSRSSRGIVDSEPAGEEEVSLLESSDSTSGSNPRRGRARRNAGGAERPRIVPDWRDDEPSAVTIETIMTGIPYEERGGTRWMDKEEEREFRRRLKRLRKKYRDN